MALESIRGRRRVARLAWIPILIAALALVAATGAGAERSTPDQQLLQEYQPVLVLHPSELFHPTKVQSFVADSELERFAGSSQSQLPLDAYWTVVDPDPEPGELGALPAGTYRLDQTSCEADAPNAGRDCYAAAWDEGSGGDAVYGRVARTDDRIVLQYWLFYYDNPLLLPAPLTGFWQSHEGDWEVVNVVLDSDESPVEAAYSQHCSGQKKAWASVTKAPAGSTHPVAYVALGSHANYFEPGLHQLASGCIPAFVPSPVRPYIFDQTGAGETIDGATIHRIDGMPWASFGGRWGESEYFFAPGLTTTPLAFGLAPATPPSQSNWNPTVVLAWPTS